MRSGFQQFFAPLRRVLPRSVAGGIRSFVTATMTPLEFARRSGHFKSSLNSKALTRGGKPIPWYTYPCIQFLQNRDFSDKTIVEFGGGQSTLWWAERAKKVVTIEQDKDWHDHLRRFIPANVDLHLVRARTGSPDMDIDHVREIFDAIPGKVDIIVNDGTGNRRMLLPLSFAKVTDTGALICDDSHGYGFQEDTKDMNILRVDFYGFQPGVIMLNSTSLLFRPECFLFSPRHPIPDLALDYYR